MVLFGRTIRIFHKYKFKIFTIKFIGMPYYFRNSEYGKTYGALRNVLPNMVHVKQYDKHMATPKIGCPVGVYSSTPHVTTRKQCTCQVTYTAHFARDGWWMWDWCSVPW